MNNDIFYIKFGVLIVCGKTALVCFYFMYWRSGSTSWVLSITEAVPV